MCAVADALRAKLALLKLKYFGGVDTPKQKGPERLPLIRLSKK